MVLAYATCVRASRFAPSRTATGSHTPMLLIASSCTICPNRFVLVLM